MDGATLTTELAARLGASYPIFGFTHSIDAVVEVTKAGGIGVWGATRQTPEEIESGLSEIRSRVGDLPFGMDLVLPSGMPDRDNRDEIEAAIPEEHREFVKGLREKYAVPNDGLPGARSRFVRSNEMASKQIEVAIDSSVDVFALGIGSPEAVIEAAKRRGKTVVSLVGAPKHAERALASGADILVAQGYDAGAHTGAIGTFSLVPQVVAVAGSTPVLAAGGVATGRHIAAAFALGAVGVWIGTAWLTTKEQHADPVTLQKLIAAGAEGTVISRADSGKTLRQLRTSWSDEWASPDAPAPLRMPYQDILVGDLLGDIERHEIEPLVHYPAGQGIGWFNAETTVAEVMAGLVSEAEATLATMSGKTVRG